MIGQLDYKTISMFFLGGNKQKTVPFFFYVELSDFPTPRFSILEFFEMHIKWAVQKGSILCF